MGFGILVRKFNWAIPFVPFTIGYKLLKKDNLNNFFIRLLLLLISIIFICSSLNNLNVEAGKNRGNSKFFNNRINSIFRFYKIYFIHKLCFIIYRFGYICLFCRY